MAKLESQTTENLTNQDLDDIDDDDQLNSQHKVTPAVYKPSASEMNKGAASKTNQSNFDVQHLIKNDLKLYANTAVPKDYLGFVQCHIKREKEGITKGFTTTFSLYFDGQNANDQSLLLTARKRTTIGGHLEYFIGNNVANPPRDLDEENAVAKLRSTNITRTEYVLYDQSSSSNNQNEAQSAAIVYDQQMFGSKEPRKLTVLLRSTPKINQQIKEGQTMIDEWRSGNAADFIEIKNKAPVYDEESKTHILTLYGNRVKLASHKNFQLTTSSGDDENNVTMQFGRIDDNNFALDYRHPLTAIQAFAIALSSFDNRFRT